MLKQLIDVVVAVLPEVIRGVLTPRKVDGTAGKGNVASLDSRRKQLKREIEDLKKKLGK